MPCLPPPVWKVFQYSAATVASMPRETAPSIWANPLLFIALIICSPSSGVRDGREHVSPHVRGLGKPVQAERRGEVGGPVRNRVAIGDPVYACQLHSGQDGAPYRPAASTRAGVR